MKQVHPNYTFVASTKTITLTGKNIHQDQLLLITNATRGVIYYNFASSSHRATVTPSGLGGVEASTTVVLTDASTTGHANNDQLIIHYEDLITGAVFVKGTIDEPNTGVGLGFFNINNNEFNVVSDYHGSQRGPFPVQIIGTDNAVVGYGGAVGISQGRDISLVSTFEPPNTSSVFVANQDTIRRLFTIYNDGPGVLHVDFGVSNASLTNYMLKMYAGDFYETSYMGRITLNYPQTLGKARIYDLY